MDLTVDQARQLAESWTIALRAERKSPHTIRTYRAGLDAYIASCAALRITVAIEPGPVQAWTALLLERGAEAATALSRQRGVRRFSAWLAGDTGDPDPLAGLRPPKLDEKIPPAISPAQMAALLATCTGRGLLDVRDRAIIGLLADTMVRASELLGMTRDAVHLADRTARVERGKGGKGRVVAYSASTARDLDRYLRARARHPQAAGPWLWLPVRRTERGQLTYWALYTTLRRRAGRADPPFALHPHMLRSAGAIAWRRKGGSVTSLMALGGWSDLGMVQRYIRAAENEIAVDEARRLFDDQ